jgi:hypothetical protein
MSDDKGMTMNLRSLGYRIDLMFPRFDGLVVDRGGYPVVRTPSNPRFWWGNFLLFPAPLALDDLPRWRELFAAEIGGPLQIDHLAFGYAFEQLGAQTLVIVTDSAEAGRIYESVGYRVAEEQVGVDWVRAEHEMLPA